MAVTVTWADAADAARVVDALLTASAVAAAEGRRTLADRYCRQANDVGDALDRLPPPPARMLTVERL